MCGKVSRAGCVRLANRQPHHLLNSPAAQQDFVMRKNDEMQPSWRLQSFEAAPHLEDEETIRAYLQAALDDPTPGVLWLALGNVSKALERIFSNR